MKLLCCSRIILILVFLSSLLFGSLKDKSAVFYYAKEISYPMVGIHNYIVVEPKNTDVYTHGFSIYKNKIYARILVKKNIEFKNKVKRLIKLGYRNFFFDFTEMDKEFISFLHDFHKDYPRFGIMINYNNMSKNLYDIVDVIVIVNYSKNKVPDHIIKKIKSHHIDIIDLEKMRVEDIYNSKKLIKNLVLKGFIPYLSNHDFSIYGKSSKNAIKREIFTLIDESKHDRLSTSAHQEGALIFEYMGYIEKLHDINKGLPDINYMRHYAGVVVWLDSKCNNPGELVSWILKLKKIGIKVVFAGNFGFGYDESLLDSFNITLTTGSPSLDNKRIVSYKNDMIGFEIEPSLFDSNEYLTPSKDSKPILVYKDKDNYQHVASAITPWGGYAMSESLILEINNENLWIINPFEFFKKSLRLKKIIVPDPTTQNGNRIFFSHVDGDGIMNGVESDPELYSGDILLEKILKPYKLPHSISVIGAEINDKGLYPKKAKRLQKIVKDMYALPNVEPATHTFTHPFFWGKIKNGDLSPEFRLKPKGYKFSLDREIRGSLENINKKYLKKGTKKKANTVYWSGDCAPLGDVLKYVYKENILNINGGDTTITNASPWLSLVAPFGLERGEYYQIYTGAQNENVFTNDWLGPFWGFKKVVQTFKLTDSPRRFKPIDVYYHIYSGSKAASINAVKYVLNWCLKQDILPLYASEYIPQVMDFYTVSMANDGDKWLVNGMKNLKTLRVEEKDASIDLDDSKTALGLKHFENHTYISLDNHEQHFIKLSNNIKYKEIPYLISSNAKLVDFKNNDKSRTFSFSGNVDVKLNINLPKECEFSSIPKAIDLKKVNNDLYLNYLHHKKVILNVRCR